MQFFFEAFLFSSSFFAPMAIVGAGGAGDNGDKEGVWGFDLDLE